MDINDLRTGVTVLMFVLFIGIVWWAYSDRRKAAYDDAARIPLDDDLPLQLTPGTGTGKGLSHE
jgi:cytochrome c oxidase cbb3-type subunit IV